MNKAENVLLSGCSAGGLTVILHCDNFASLLLASTKVKCLSNAGFFINAKNLMGTELIKAFYNDVVTTHGVTKLPFIDERRLLSETKKLENTLTDEEKSQDTIMSDIIYVYKSHPLATQASFLYHICSRIPNQEYIIPIDTNLRNATYHQPLHNQHFPEIPDGVIMPSKIVRLQDMKPFHVLWHEDSGRLQPRERLQVCEVCGVAPILGAAAHRLVKNSLHINANNSADRNGSCTMNKSRPQAYMGYERDYIQYSDYPGQNQRVISDSRRLFLVM